MHRKSFFSQCFHIPSTLVAAFGQTKIADNCGTIDSVDPVLPALSALFAEFAALPALPPGLEFQ
jgi:hypothetical protein